VALVEVYVVGAQAPERGVDLLADLLSGEALVLAGVIHREVELRREEVRVARAAAQHVTEKRLGCAAPVDVGGVEEVDPHLEGLVDAGAGGVGSNADAVRQPGAEGDLGDTEIARAELSVAHRANVPNPP
jgi:hypothetical protein